LKEKALTKGAKANGEAFQNKSPPSPAFSYSP